MQWLALAHPVLIILFVYPVIGATIRLGILARSGGDQSHRCHGSVEHADHGRWPPGDCWWPSAFSHAGLNAGRCARLGQSRCCGLCGRWFVCVSAARKASSAEADRCLGLLADASFVLQPLPGAAEALEKNMILHSHTWGGVLLLALLLLTMAVQREIASGSGWMHVLVNVLVALLLATRAISGTRGLLMR